MNVFVSGLFFTVLILCAMSWFAMSRESDVAKRWIILGFILRLLGCFAYIYMIFFVYGEADALMYMDMGGRQALLMEVGRWDIVTRYYWENGLPAWGTQFVINLTGFLIHYVGSSLVILSVLFTTLGYLGCVLIARAVRSEYGQGAYERFLPALMVMPSLWFWPSALGKDAIVLLGIGCAVSGYAARRSLWRVGGVIAGLLAVYMIRPQVALVVAASLAAGLLFASRRGWTVGRVAAIVGSMVLVAAAASIASSTLGFSVFNTDELDLYLSSRATSSAIGGSAIELSGPVWLRPFLAFGTTLFRPFLWEVSGVTALLSAVEIFGFWALAWWKRDAIIAFVRHQPRGKLFWFSVVFVLVYATTAGLAVGNLGTLVRQRIHLSRFLPLFMFAVPVRRAVPVRSVQARPALPVGAP